MKLTEKQELVRLLNLYQAELLKHNEENIKEAARHEKRYEGTYHLGIKAQYEHARRIATKLSVEIGKEVKSYWQL